MEMPALPGERLGTLVLNANGHAFDSRTGTSYRFNPPAQVALLMLQDGKSRQAIIETLADLCDQPEAAVEGGVDHLVDQLARYLA